MPYLAFKIINGIHNHAAYSHDDLYFFDSSKINISDVELILTDYGPLGNNEDAFKKKESLKKEFRQLLNNGNELQCKFSGMSRIDGCPIFSIDLVTEKRNMKLKNILSYE